MESKLEEKMEKVEMDVKERRSPGGPQRRSHPLSRGGSRRRWKHNKKRRWRRW